MSGAEIIHIAPSFGRTCGVGDYTGCLAEAQAAAGAKVAVWSAVESPVPRGNTLTLGSIPDRWDAAAVRSLAEKLRDAAPRLVHLQYEAGLYHHRAAMPVFLPLYLHRYRIPLVTTFHSLDGPRRWGKVARLALIPLLLGSRSVVVCSRRQREALWQLPVLRRRVVQIPVGSTIPVVHHRPAKPDAGLHLVYFGFLWRGRYIETVIRTLAAVRTRVPDATLTLIGEPADPEYFAELLCLAAEQNVSDSVRFYKDLPALKVSKVLAHSDLALLPYPTGVSTGRTTLMAALAHGCPVVTMSSPANLESGFWHGANMLLTPAGDEPAFIGAATLLATDPALRNRLSHGATALTTEFTWERIAAQTLALPGYREVMSR
ncbi:MAG: glycosyltransferase family 4 protein [Armatimonadaceae bacterium]